MTDRLDADPAAAVSPEQGYGKVPGMDIADQLAYEIGVCDEQLERLVTLDDPITRAMRDEITGRRSKLEHLLAQHDDARVLDLRNRA